MNKASSDDTQQARGINESGRGGGSAESMQAQRTPSPGPLGPPLVDTQELRPSYSPNGSQSFEHIQVIDPTTGEIIEYETSERPGILTRKYTKTDHQNTRAERWAMKWALDALLPGSRQFKCHRYKIPGRDLEVKLSLEHQKAFYAGFECCGSVWGCPLCAPKITERRRVEVNQAIERAKEMGLQIMLATFTIPHGIGSDVEVIRKQMMQAWRRGSTTRAGKQMRKMIGLRGYIRVVEVTFGENGWHPHMHVLLIVDTTWSPEVIRRLWYPIWLDGCRKVGLEDPSEAHGVRVDDGTHAANYVSKWGMDSELTKGHLKKGRKSVNPWDLLRAHALGLEHHAIAPELRDILQGLGIDEKRAGALFLVFFGAFKGSRQLYWSNGLRALLGLEAEKTDEQLAQEEMDKAAALLATLTDEQRHDLIRTKNLPTLLILAEDSPGLIPEFLDSLRKPPTSQ